MNARLPTEQPCSAVNCRTNFTVRLLMVLALLVLLLLTLATVLGLGARSAPQSDVTSAVSSNALAFAGNSFLLDERYQNGEFLVSVFADGRWQEIGRLGYNEYPTKRGLSLADVNLTGDVLVRIEHRGETAAHIDSALLDGQPPSGVVGASEDAVLTLKKLSDKDHDVIDAQGKALVLVFDAQIAPSAFSLVARIESQRLLGTPFQFPPENTYQEMGTSSAFYTYVWDSQRGGMSIDGDLAAESLGAPFFAEWTEPGSGHPAGYTYGWVRNDGGYLYVAIDFTPDNTMDGDKDYAKVYVNTPAGLRAFRVSLPEQAWGAPGFIYTERVGYQHKVYEFAIPLDELGLGDLESGAEVELAFAAYGTAEPAPPLYPGPLDPSFGGDGIVTTTVGDTAIAHAVIEQAGGKIVVAGYSRYSFSSNYLFTLARYNSDGSLDTSFGPNSTGIVTTAIGSTARAQGLVLQSDGKIVAAGFAHNGTDYDFALARYDVNGNLDPSFGPNGTGVVTTNIGSSGDRAYAVALQSNNRIIAAGHSNDGSGDDFALARYDANGNLDTMFGISGVMTSDVSGGSDTGYAVVIQSDERIVVAGEGQCNHSPCMALARYTPNGAPDIGFGASGVVTTPVGASSSASAVALQSGDRIVVAGSSRMASANEDFTLARYDSDGNLDATFGLGGIARTPFGNDSVDYAQAIAIRHDDVIIAAGYNKAYYVAAVQYNSNGGPLGAFGNTGRVNTDIGPDYDYGYAMCLQSDGRIVVAGSGWSGDTAFAIVRYGRDLSIHKMVAPASVAPGQAITYTIVFSNTGALATNVGIVDQFPLSVTVTSIISSGVPLTPTVTGPAVYAWKVGQLGYGQGGVITIVGTVNTASVTDWFSNTVRINTDRWDSDLRNNQSTAVVGPYEIWLPITLREQ